MKNLLAFLKKNTMLVVLILVYLFFMVMTGGSILKPLNFNALITQNAYVYILAAGMLMCMLTGGNIDLSCGSFVCLVGAVGGVMMVIKGMNTGLSIALMLLFMQNPGKPLSRETLLTQVWGEDFDGDDKVVDVNIRRLRIKLEEDSTAPHYLHTVWGFGYRWDA